MKSVLNLPEIPESSQELASQRPHPAKGIYVTVEMKTAEQGTATDESYALHPVAHTSCVPSILVNQLVSSQTMVCPATHPALKVHSEVVKPAGRRKSEVLERLRKRQLSQGSLKTKPGQHVRGGSAAGTPVKRNTVSPLKGSWLIHSSKATAQTFDFQGQDLKVQGRPPRLRGHLASLLQPRALRKTATTISAS